MESIIKYVVGELSTIVHAPGVFVTAVLALGAAVWWAMDWRYAGVIANRDSEISSLRTQRDEYKEKLQGATPSEAKARIDSLEAQVAALAPRRLTNDQRARLAASLKLPSGMTYTIALIAEASGDSPQFEADLSASFRDAGGWSLIEPTVMGIGSRPPLGLAIQLPDPTKPSPATAIVMNAFHSISLKYAIQPIPTIPHNADVAVLICTKIER
jgi:hypothetical protein